VSGDVVDMHLKRSVIRRKLQSLIWCQCWRGSYHVSLRYAHHLSLWYKKL